MNLVRVLYIGATFSPNDSRKGVEKGIENVRNNSLVGLHHKRNGWPRHYQRVWGFQSIWIMANSTANALPELSFAICHPITRIQSNPLHSRITEIALPIFDPFNFNIFLPSWFVVLFLKISISFFIFIENSKIKFEVMNNW